ncbi:hypothetical protein [Denitrobacterium detoxificans]|jgi:hypothetical protein|uniref:hypothetical protein n=1 Tax=Denitrobacterium detoxificans TaxID=79604 RepID=UPI0026F0B11F|nr:hypothetical protein [Denitrobacterium detoxificans]MBE6466429.1 hypothetical protein [Denitrobacterium detoxificans]
MLHENDCDGHGNAEPVSLFPERLIRCGSGVGGVALFIVAMIAAFVVLGCLIFAIGKILGRVANRK